MRGLSNVMSSFARRNVGVKSKCQTSLLHISAYDILFNSSPPLAFQERGSGVRFVLMTLSLIRVITTWLDVNERVRLFISSECFYNNSLTTLSFYGPLGFLPKNRCFVPYFSATKQSLYDSASRSVSLL